MATKDQIKLSIDGRKIQVPQGTTIMEAAETIGIHIPRLCFHPELSLQGSCRICIVAVEGMDFFMASCSVAVWNGMVVQTNSEEIRRARRDIVELLLDNHPRECQLCERDGRCELQNMAYALGVRERLFEGERKRFAVDSRSASVVRDQEKCILCGRCVRVCDEVQGVTNLSQHGRGFTTNVSPAHDRGMDESVCIQCGQCVNACPTAAFLEKRHTENVWQALADPKKHVIVQTAPSIRAAIGEGFGIDPGTPCTGRMVAALRRLGFDTVFDTDIGADLTIMEEASEFTRRLDGEGVLPIITSCSPGWVNFMEKFYPGLIPHASSCRSPMGMLSILSKTYYAEKTGIDPADIYMVAVMPCVAKKYEIERPEHHMESGNPYTDAVLTTRELIWMIQSHGINFTALTEEEFDAPLGIATGAGDIFGTTGGVMEATLRTASEWLTGKPAERLEFKEVRAVEGLREAELTIGSHTLKVAVANGLVNAKTLLDQVITDKQRFHVIEIMACPGGCIGGGGQPYPKGDFRILDPRLLALRAGALYNVEGKRKYRRSHENPAIKTIYDDFLGEPGSEKALRLLHTEYAAKLPRGI